MPARTVAALRLLASRWLRSCWITRWECCGWGEEDVLAPDSPPRGLWAGRPAPGPQAGLGRGEPSRFRFLGPSPLGPTQNKGQLGKDLDPHHFPGLFHPEWVKNPC